MRLLSTLATLGIGVLLVHTLVDALRWRRLYWTECENQLQKRDLFTYTDCKNPGTLVVAYGGREYHCAQARNDLDLGAIYVATERWLKEAWWYPERPYLHLADNPWALTLIACVTVISLIVGLIWLIAWERSERRILIQHERDQQRMERQQNRLLHALDQRPHSLPQARALEYRPVIQDRHAAWRRSSMPDMYATGSNDVIGGIPSYLVHAATVTRSHSMNGMDDLDMGPPRAYVRGKVRSSRRSNRP